MIQFTVYNETGDRITRNIVWFQDSLPTLAVAGKVFKRFDKRRHMSFGALIGVFACHDTGSPFIVIWNSPRLRNNSLYSVLFDSVLSYRYLIYYFDRINKSSHGIACESIYLARCMEHYWWKWLEMTSLDEHCIAYMSLFV